MKTHELKIWPSYYDLVRSGRMTFQVRVNDRDFAEGDRVILKCFDPSSREFLKLNPLEFRIGTIVALEVNKLGASFEIFSLLPIEGGAA